MILFLATAISVVLLGLIFKFAISPLLDPEYEITWPEFVIGTALLLVVLVPSVVLVGNKLAKGSKLSYNEFWSGYETKAIKKVTHCTRDGSCVHTYNCDPYEETHTETYTDSQGNTQTRTYETTEYHQCPYTDEEWSFYIDTTLGQFTVAENRLPSHPSQHKYRTLHYVPDFASGVPHLWSQAKKRIDQHHPGPVTERNSYDNYILASQSTILKKNSDAIRKYRKLKVLPKPATTVYDLYQADKVYFVGKAIHETTWRHAVNQFNAALGSEKQADLHLVVVTNPAITNQDEYFQALVAYWQSPALGDDAISKNGLIVMLFVQDNVIQYARAATGMPTGNELVLDQIGHELKGKPFEPSVVLGSPVGTLVHGKVKVEHTDGIVETIVWEKPGFQRVCMVCKGKGDHGLGYLYLSKEIHPSTGQEVAIWATAMFVGIMVWVGLLILTVGNPLDYRR